MIQRIRRWFCKHEYECIATKERYFFESDKIPYRRIRIYRCRKCGYVQRVRL